MRPMRGAPRALGQSWSSVGSRPASLDDRGAFRRCRTIVLIRDDYARQGDPVFTDRLVRILPARLIQTDTMARGNERRRQIPSEADLLVLHPVWPFQEVSLHRWVLPAIRRTGA